MEKSGSGFERYLDMKEKVMAKSQYIFAFLGLALLISLFAFFPSYETYCEHSQFSIIQETAAFSRVFCGGYVESTKSLVARINTGQTSMIQEWNREINTNLMGNLLFRFIWLFLVLWSIAKMIKPFRDNHNADVIFKLIRSMARSIGMAFVLYLGLLILFTGVL